MIQLFNKITAKQLKGKKSYQLYDRISFEETDDASNYSLTKLPEKVLYETNRVERNPSKRIYFLKSKDFPCGSEGVTIPIVTKKDLRDGSNRDGYGYYHIAAVQILVKFLGNSGIDIPLRIAVRDQRIKEAKKSIIGLWSSNLFTGAVYTVVYLDYTISATDANLDEMLTLNVKPTIDMKEGSKPIAIETRTYASWILTSHAFRKRDAEYNGDRIAQGRSIIIKSKDTDVSVIPQPIPVEKLSMDLDFEFPKEETNLHVGTSSEVDYYHDGNTSFRVTLKEPTRFTKGKSKIKAQRHFDNDLEEVDSDS